MPPNDETYQIKFLTVQKFKAAIEKKNEEVGLSRLVATTIGNIRKGQGKRWAVLDSKFWW